MNNITDIEKLNFYSWTDDGMDENPNGIPSEDVFVLRSDVLKVLQQNKVSDVSAEEVFVFELIGKRLEQISVAFQNMDDAHGFIETMKQSFKYKESVLVASIVTKSIVNGRIDIPEWYTVQEIYNWLRHENYNEKIAKELSEKWAKSNQSAFAKGWEKATNDKSGTFDYKYFDERKDNVGVSDAIEFADWIRQSKYVVNSMGYWFCYDNNDSPSTMRLYEYFQESQQTNK